MTEEGLKTVFRVEMGRLLREQRERLGLSLEAVSENVEWDISLNTISLIERGEQFAYGWQVHQLTKVLRLSADDLFSAAWNKVMETKFPDLKHK
jgi:transcriptional regulator with XRE-family HTH domain